MTVSTEIKKLSSSNISFLDEYLGKQARSIDKEKILNIVKELNNKGIFFVIIDGKIYVYGIAIDTNNIGDLCEIFKYVNKIDNKIEIEKINVSFEENLCSEDSKKYFNFNKKIDSSKNDLEVDIIKKHKNYFSEQISYTNDEEKINEQKSILNFCFEKDKNTNENEKKIINDVEINKSLDFHKKLTSENKQIIFKVNGKILSIYEVKALFNDLTLTELTSRIKFSDNAKKLIAQYGDDNFLENEKKFFAVLIAEPKFNIEENKKQEKVPESSTKNIKKPEEETHEAEEKAILDTEDDEKIKKEEEKEYKKVAEEKARQEEERKRKEEEERKRLEKEEKARKEAEEKAKQEAEERARQEEEERARKEEEERARKEEEERARQEEERLKEEKARKEAEEKAKQEAEERARQEAEEKAKQEAEERAKQEAEERARQEEEERIRKKKEEKRLKEEKARKEAEDKAKQEAEEIARKEAEERARQEEERKRKEAEEAKRKADEEKARKEAEEKAKQEAEERARQEEERKRKEEERRLEEKARQEEEEKRRLEEEEARKLAEANAALEEATEEKIVGYKSTIVNELDDGNVVVDIIGISDKGEEKPVGHYYFRRKNNESILDEQKIEFSDNKNDNNYKEFNEESKKSDEYLKYIDEKNENEIKSKLIKKDICINLSILGKDCLELDENKKCFKEYFLDDNGTIKTVDDGRELYINICVGEKAKIIKDYEIVKKVFDEVAETEMSKDDNGNDVFKFSSIDLGNGIDKINIKDFNIYSKKMVTGALCNFLITKAEDICKTAGLIEENKVLLNNKEYDQDMIKKKYGGISEEEINEDLNKFSEIFGKIINDNNKQSILKKCFGYIKNKNKFLSESSVDIDQEVFKIFADIKDSNNKTLNIMIEEKKVFDTALLYLLISNYSIIKEINTFMINSMADGIFKKDNYDKLTLIVSGDIFVNKKDTTRQISPRGISRSKTSGGIGL